MERDDDHDDLIQGAGYSSTHNLCCIKDECQVSSLMNGILVAILNIASFMFAADNDFGFEISKKIVSVQLWTFTVVRSLAKRSLAFDSDYFYFWNETAQVITSAFSVKPD